MDQSSERLNCASELPTSISTIRAPPKELAHPQVS